MPTEKLIIFVLMFALQTLANSEIHSNSKVKTFEFAVTGPDIRIPSAIWKQIGGDEGKDTVTFAPIKVRLVEKTPGTLLEPEIEIQLPRGGGQIDLSKFVKNQTGTFEVFFDFEEDLNSEKFHAFFVSQARKRKLDGEIWGAGCNKYMDIKKFILNEASKKGLKVNVTRSRHDSVLGGSFIFALAQHQVTQVTFTDSHQPHLFCGTSQEK